MDTLRHVSISTVRWNRAVTAALIALTWVFVVLLTIPRAISRGVADYGFLTGIAERLRAGDTLYVQVWDNKDPLVYYALALSRSFGPNGVIGAWLLELAWVVLAAVAIYVIARFQGLTRVMSSYLGFGLAPLIFLGAAYYMGSTHPPAIALLLAAVALLYSRHPVTAGVLLGVLLFFKLVMFPMAIVVLAMTVFALRRRADTKWLILGFASVFVAMSVILAVRGELIGYIATQPDNVLHSQTPIVSPDQTGIVERLKRYLVILVNPQIAAIQFTTLAVLLLTRPKSLRRIEPNASLWWITVSAFIMAVGTIAITGKWFHHAQVLEVSSALALILIVEYLTRARHVRAWIAAAVAAVLTYPLAGLPQPQIYVDAFTQLSTRWVQATTVDTMTRILREQPPGSVSFIGETVAQSSGLEEWSVACRHIGQRPFNHRTLFDETLECLPTSEVIVISKDITTTSAFPEYDEFLAGVRSLLAEQYTCEQVETLTICRRAGT